MPDLMSRRAALLTRLDDLKLRLHEIAGELDSHHSQDWEELAVEREDDEVLERLGVTGQAEIQKIKAALDRMNEGEYGFCVRCGSEISANRLDLIPFTPFCAKCAP